MKPTSTTKTAIPPPLPSPSSKPSHSAHSSSGAEPFPTPTSTLFHSTSPERDFSLPTEQSHVSTLAVHHPGLQTHQRRGANADDGFTHKNSDGGYGSGNPSLMERVKEGAHTAWERVAVVAGHLIGNDHGGKK